MTRKYKTEDFTLYIEEQVAGKKPQITVSKRVAKKATDRNRIKRVIKESLKALELKDVYYKIYVHKNIASSKSTEITENIKQILK